MPTLPQKTEAQNLKQLQFAELSRQAFPRSDPNVLFAELQKHIRATLGVDERLSIAVAGFAYSNRVRYALASDELAEAKRLVRAARRAIYDLKKISASYQARAGRESPKSRRGTGLECWSKYQDATQYYQRLCSLIGDLPNEQLDAAEEAVYQVLQLVAPPFSGRDYAAALACLDDVLARWRDVTSSRQGQTRRNRAVNDCILALARIFKVATGAVPTSKNRFLHFLEAIIGALPTGSFRKGADETLAKRVERLLRSNRSGRSESRGIARR